MRLDIKILLLIALTNAEDEMFYSYKPMLSSELKFVLYGDVANFQDLFSKSLNYSDEFQITDKEMAEDDKVDDMNFKKEWFEKEIDTLNAIDNSIKDKPLPDGHDFQNITQTYDFRRYSHYYEKAGWGGVLLSWLGIWGNLGGYDPEDSKDIENLKLDMLEDCGLQFLIHARFKIQAAMRVKSPYRGDKRYMLGYLFNRVRRVLYDQRKVVYIARMTNKYRYRRKLRALLRLYQQVARYDVDLTDLARYIRRVYKKKADFDRYHIF